MWYQQNENTNLIANRFSITGSGTHLTKSGRQPVLSIALRTLTFFWLVGTARLKSSNNFTSKYFRWQRKLSGQFDLRATCWGWGAGCLVRYWQLICWPWSLNVSSANPVLEHVLHLYVFITERVHHLYIYVAEEAQHVFVMCTCIYVIWTLHQAINSNRIKTTQTCSQ